MSQIEIKLIILIFIMSFIAYMKGHSKGYEKGLEDGTIIFKQCFPNYNDEVQE